MKAKLRGPTTLLVCITQMATDHSPVLSPPIAVATPLSTTTTGGNTHSRSP